MNIERQVILDRETGLACKDFPLFGLDVVVGLESIGGVVGRVEDREGEIEADFAHADESGEVFFHKLKDALEVGFEHGSVSDGGTVGVPDGLGWVETCTGKDEAWVLDREAEDVAGVDEVFGDGEDRGEACCFGALDQGADGFEWDGGWVYVGVNVDHDVFCVFVLPWSWLMKEREKERESDGLGLMG